MLKVLLRRCALALSIVGLAALPAACDEPPKTGGNQAQKPAGTKPKQIAEKEKKDGKPADATKVMVGRVTLAEALSDKVLGKKDAPITILAFESLGCPACASFHAKTLPALKKHYIETGKAKIVFIDFPTNQRAHFAAMLARCTGNDRFFAIIEMLFRSQMTWLQSGDFFKDLSRIGRLGGLNETQFKSCMDSKALFETIAKRQQEASAKHGVRYTPTFVINGKKLVGAQPFDDFDALMKPMLK